MKCFSLDRRLLKRLFKVVGNHLLNHLMFRFGGLDNYFSSFVLSACPSGNLRHGENCARAPEIGKFNRLSALSMPTRLTCQNQPLVTIWVPTRISIRPCSKSDIILSYAFLERVVSSPYGQSWPKGKRAHSSSTLSVPKPNGHLSTSAGQAR